MTQYFSKALYICLFAMVGVACGAPPDQNNNNQQNNNTVNNNNQQGKLGTVKIWLKDGQLVSSSKICFFPFNEMRDDQRDDRSSLSIAWNILKKNGKLKLDCVMASAGRSNSVNVSLPVGDYFIFDDTQRYISRYSMYVGVLGVKSIFGKITIKSGGVIEQEIDHGLIIMTNGDLTPDGSWWCSIYDPEKNLYLDNGDGKFGVTFQEGKLEYIIYLEKTPFWVGEGNTFRPYHTTESLLYYKGTFDKVGDNEWSFVGTSRYSDDPVSKPDWRTEYRCQPLRWVQINRWGIDPDKN